MPHDNSSPPLNIDPRVAHELRSSINAVSLAVDLFDLSGLKSVQKEAVTVARRNIQTLSDLIDQLSGTTRANPSSEPSPNQRPPPGIQVLVVEDEYFLAQIVSDHLKHAGCEVIGPAGTIEDALDLVAEKALNCAVVDMNLGGEFSSPVIRALITRGIPVGLLSGYDQAAIPDVFRELPFLHKPVNPSELLRLVAKLSGSPAARHRGR